MSQKNFKHRSLDTQDKQMPNDSSFQHRWASNVTGWDEGNVKLLVRSLDPKFTNMVSLKRKGPLIQLDFSFVELDLQPSNTADPGENFEQQINLQDSCLLPHTTMLLPDDVAQTLMLQLYNLFNEPQQNEGETVTLESSDLSVSPSE